ncbi:SLAM family member 9-like [Sinocyclocheilus grahami]|uniref:SLAM family member 9-like n=1 Tax=Sinocyclocheilus grahami TaxID=75366 RepID=UPI0007AC7EE2|nr:PREDICTED: SLAM family member 9-like [Sinocyclocheilus grahami]
MALKTGSSLYLIVLISVAAVAGSLLIVAAFGIFLTCRKFRKTDQKGAFGVDADGMKLVSVMEGDSVTLNSGLTEMMDDDVIRWRFGAENTLIVRMNIMDGSMTVYDDVLDERFRDRLKVDHQTGSLTITNITTQHAGDYKLQSNSARERFSLNVQARLPVPVISSNSTHCSSSSSSSYCSLVCSVVNVGHVTLSWYKGNSLLSSISVSDLSISLSLPLEVGYQDNNTYSCVLNNPISNQTTHLDISQLCHTCAEVHVSSCDTIEPVIRLVVTALMGVAAAAAAVLLVNDVRSTRVTSVFGVKEYPSITDTDSDTASADSGEETETVAKTCTATVQTFTA